MIGQGLKCLQAALAILIKGETARQTREALLRAILMGDKRSMPCRSSNRGFECGDNC